jgi:hypothetical protein
MTLNSLINFTHTLVFYRFINYPEFFFVSSFVGFHALFIVLIFFWFSAENSTCWFVFKTKLLFNPINITTFIFI